MGSIIPSEVVEFEAKKCGGGWADLLRTQLQEFKPLTIIPDYTSCYHPPKPI